jgi:hypothetical protein
MNAGQRTLEKSGDPCEHVNDTGAGDGWHWSGGGSGF